MKNRYRIVKDAYLGYEVQIKYWFFPFIWFMAGVNTFANVERAEEYAKTHHKKVIKYL